MAGKPRSNRLSGLKGVAQIVAHEERNEMQYTELRGTVFWFRRRVPPPLQPSKLIIIGDVSTRIGKTGYVRFSLKTSDRREAGKLARKYAHYLDQEAEKVANARNSKKRHNQTTGELTEEEIRYASEYMYASLLKADEATAEEGVAAMIADEDPEEIRQPDRYLWSTADLPPVTLSGQVELLKRLQPVISFYVYQTTEKLISAVTPKMVPFADAFRRYIAALEKRRASEHVPTPAAPKTTPKWTWKDAFAYYATQRPNLAESTIKNYATAWLSLEAEAKCLPAELKAEQIVTWRDGLLKKLNASTAKDRLTFAGAIWKESWINGKIDRSLPNPFEGLRVKLGTNVKRSRLEYTDDELRTIFSAPPLQTARAVSVHAGYWLPLLALYTGARLEELTGLQVDDIQDAGKELVIHIRENQIRPRLKGRHESERRIPLHPVLKKLGFPAYVKATRASGIQRVFPSLTSGATFGEEFVTHVKKLISPAPKRLVGMHCFRHNWQTAKRNGRLDPAAANYMTGRRIEKGSAGDYGNPAGLAVLRSELSKIRYGLTHLPAPAVTAEMLRAQDKQRPKNRGVKAADRLASR